MQRSLTLALVLLLALAVAAFWWFRAGPPPSPADAGAHPPTASAAPGAAASADVPPAATAPAATTANERDAANPADAARSETGRGVLRVFARWPGDLPAADVHLHVRTASYRRGYQVVGQAVTDAAGLATFVGLDADKYSLRSDRGDRKDVDVTGGEQEVVFELEAGVAVIGRVVAPDDRPVAGASVWLQTQDPLWTGGRALAITGAHGRFALEHVPTKVSLGAFAKGFARSELLDLDVVDTSKPPVDVTLRLLPGGGELVGIVVDERDAPIARALVGIGREDGSIDMRGERVIERWSVRTAETDDRGRFALDGLAAGEQPLTVRATGYGFRRSTCTVVAGETTEVTVQMQRSGTIRGIVRGADDAPMPGARIRCYDIAPKTPFLAGGQIDFDETFGYLAVAADGNGAYEVRDATAGTAWVFAQPGTRPNWGDPVPYATAELEVPPGGTVEWNPVVTEGHTVAGVVRYRDGHPMGDVFITLIDEKTQAQHVLTNNKEGEFRFTNLEPSTYTARVQYWDAPKGAPALEQSGIVPDRGRVELKAPFDKPVKQAPGSVLGRVDDVGGRIENPKAARVALMSDRNWFRDDGALVDGAFRFDDVEPCRFRLALMEEESTLACSDWFELLPGAVLDTGVLTTVPGGAVHVTVTRASGTEECAPKLWFQQDGAPRGTSLEIGRASEAQVGSLTPGSYRVTAWAKNMAYVETAVTVAAGTTTELPLRFEAGRTCRFSVWLPADATMTRYRYVVAGHDDRVLRDKSGDVGTMPTRPFPVVVSAPLGEWTLTFTADDRLTGAVSFRVTAADGDLELRLDLAAK